MENTTITNAFIIKCEIDFYVNGVWNIDTVFETRELAQQFIDGYDWKNDPDYTDGILDDSNFISIEPFNYVTSNIKYRIDCEWDMGMDWEDKFFNTKADAMDSINSVDWECTLEEGETISDLMDDGLLIIEPISVG